jgi:hypothetical protein
MAIPDHQVTIVGWDDNYEVENFNEDHRPTKPGAYIIMNSHGTDMYDKGFLAISYKDSLVELYCIGTTKVSETKSQGETLYQFKLTGQKFVIGIKAIKGNLDSYAQIGVETKAGKFWKNVSSNQGESYLSIDGQHWKDLKELGNEIDCPDANTCLKAVTTKGIAQI